MEGVKPLAFGGIAALLLLVIACKFVKALLRIFAGLVVLALLGWGVWHFLMK